MDYFCEALLKQADFNNIATAIIKKHSRFNKVIAVFAIASAVYAYTNEKKISKLEKQVEELKCTKGE